MKNKCLKAVEICLYILTGLLLVAAAVNMGLKNNCCYVLYVLSFVTLICGFVVSSKVEKPARKAEPAAEKKHSKAALVTLVVALAVIVVCSFVARLVETNGFSVKVSDFTLTQEMSQSYNGGMINGKSFAMPNDTTYSVTMYVPKTATADKPAATVFVLPGFTRTKATMAQYCIELARRGFVVFCSDPGGQGGTTETSTTGANGIEYLVQYVYNNTDDFKFVDRNRFGAVGHSAGGGNVCTLAADMAGSSFQESVIKSVYISGYIKVSSANKYKSLRCNAAMSYAYYDEGAFRYQADTSALEIVSQRFINEVNGKDLGYKDYAVDYGYGDLADGTYRIIHREGINHCFEMYDKTSIANTIEFFDESLGVNSGIDGFKQVWFLKELSNGLALAAAFTFVLALTAILMDTGFFATMKKDQHLPAASGSSTMTHKISFWGAMIITATIACLDYIPLANLSINIFPTGNSSSVFTFVFPARMINAILLWAAINGAIGLVIFFGTTLLEYVIDKARGKINAENPFDWGKFTIVKISGNGNVGRVLANTGKAILLALINFCAFYLLVQCSYMVFHQDFRFTLVSASPLNPRMLVTALEYMPIIFVFYISNSIRVNGSIAREGWKEWKVLLVGALANSLGLVAILIINYSSYFTTGVPFYGYWGNGTEVWLYINMVFALTVMMFILPIFNRLYCKLTGNVWTGAIACCMIFVMMTISASVSYIPMY